MEEKEKPTGADGGKKIRIALAGNPNCGKTTLFNALTGSNQFVGNWPGVTVEKKEGKLKKRDNVIITDLPGIYSLSPYTLEEVVARNYLIGERPDAILNIVDATNLERNLYLTTQLTELGIPVVIALNMMDVVKKNGDKINVEALSKHLGCKIIPISALKGDGILTAAEEAIKAAEGAKTVPMHTFSGVVEHALAHIEEAALHGLPEERQRWYAIKVFERDEKVVEQLKLSDELKAHIERDIEAAEKELDDDAESIITNERYVYIAEILKGSYKKRDAGKLTVSDKIDKIVTNRWLALPIFAVIMFLVYFVSVTTVGAWATDWANDGVFGDGWHLLGIGSRAYNEAVEEFDDANDVIGGFIDYYEETYGDEMTAEEKETLDGYRDALDVESEEFDGDAASAALDGVYSLMTAKGVDEITYEVIDEETLVSEEKTAGIDDLKEATEIFKKDAIEEYKGSNRIDPYTHGVYVPGIPVLLEKFLDAIHCNEVVKGLVLDGIVAGVGAVLGFVPQIFVLFIFLAFLEACGYMSRIAFVLDRIFRKFGLSGKSFIPMLIGTGCGVPGIMASRTIENERDRRMTIMTTTFIPCGAKLPFIAMIAGLIFNGAWWVAPSAYFLGMFAIITSGIILKKFKMFAGEPAPFVMELPAYHLPTVGNVLRSMWERGWSFIKKAGTIILLSTIVIWFLTYFGVAPGKGFGYLAEEEIEYSILAKIGSVFAWIFAPLGFGTWQAAVASLTGIVAKENIVGTMNIIYGNPAAIASVFTAISGYSFMIFNLLCAPCFAAIGAIKREMNNRKWTWFAIGYQCGYAYVLSFIFYAFANLFAGTMFGGAFGNVFGGVVALIIAIGLLAGFIYLLVRPYKEPDKLTEKV